MPCTDGPSLAEENQALARENKKLAAMLCGTLRRVENLSLLGLTMSGVNEAECGISGAKILAWFTRHKEEDARRKAAEQAALHKANLKREALAKLTPEERAALGLK
jgi:hypothetical protein